MSLGRIGLYEVLERIGEGGMGVVFRARDTRLERVVALKVLAEDLSEDVESRARLRREARAEASLSHPNIATCFELGEAPLEPPDLLRPGAEGPHPARVAFLAMEFVPGDDLVTLVTRRPMSVPRAVDLALQVAAGLDAAHRSGIVHRDLKPGNVRVTPEGIAKILDFGLARVRAESAGEARPPSFHTSEHHIMGTVPYMSPEQARGAEVDARSDLFSLGVLLYQIVTGRLPFEGRNRDEIQYSIANQEPQPLARYASQVPDELERITRKLLAKRVADRYQSAHEVVTDLRALGQELETVRVEANGRRSGRRLPAWLERRWPLYAGLAAVLAVAGLMGQRWYAGRTAGIPGSARNVAVLSFRNLTGDRAHEPVGAALAADLLTHFVERTDLVVTRPEARDLPAGLDLGDVARELGVRSLLQGELRGEAGRLRLEAWLVDGPTRRVLWAGGYDLRPGDLRDVRDAIVRGVTKRLGGRERPPARVIVAASPHAAEAHEAYLQGLEELEDTDDPLARGRAAEAFERAVTLDPGNALAWAGRARALWWRYDREDDRALLALADQASKEAVRLSPGLVQARLVRAQILRSTGHTPEAITEVEEARRLNPAYDGSLLQLALIHRKLGDYDRAIACMRELTRLRPGYWRTWNDLGNVYLRHGNHAAAREAYRRAIDLAPGRNRPRESLANVEILEGRYAAALDLYRHLPQPVLDAALASNIATAYFFSKDLANARRYYLLAVSLEPRDAVLRVNLGDCYARLGQRASARAQYREAVGLTEEALHSEPDNMGLRAQLIVQRAKAGDCEGARAEFEARGAGIPDTDLEVLRDLAKAHALCGDRVRALAAIRRAIVDLGAPGRLFGDEDEFVSLRQDAEFRALVARNNP